MSAETAVVARMLAPFAIPAARLFARRVGIDRWRILRRVTKSSGLNFPTAEYRRFLKTLCESDFLLPVEDALPALVVRLDAVLAGAGPRWEERRDRLSASKVIVEHTFMHLLAVLSRIEFRVISEEWSRSRNERITVSLIELARSTGRLKDLGALETAHYLDRRSMERRRIRMAALGVEWGQIDSVLAIQPAPLPEVAKGSVRVVSGPYGSGKSELAEQWHREGIGAFRNDLQTQIPIWIDARDLREGVIDQVVAAGLGGREIFWDPGVQLVVDGLDEVEGSRAVSIVSDLRVAAAGTASSILVTSRPDVVPRDELDVQMEPLRMESVRALIKLLSPGSRGYETYDWPASLLESATRPFFAIAIARTAGSKPATNAADLIRLVVEQAMLRGSTLDVARSGELFGVLVDFAIRLTSGADRQSIAFSFRLRALATRLVAESDDGRLAFSLPIFEQWFAAQAIVLEDCPLETIFASEASFERWRWAVAIAATSLDAARIDRLVRDSLKVNIGAGSWLIEQVSSGVPSASAMDLDPTETARRVLFSTRAWIDSLGSLAHHCLPLESRGQGFRIGVRTDGPVLTKFLSRTTSPRDEVVLVSQALNFWDQEDADWIGVQKGVPRGGRYWPWVLLRDSSRKGLLEVLERGTDLGLAEGVWLDELRYAQARQLAGGKSVLHPPIDAGELLEKVGSLKRTHPGARVFGFSRRFEMSRDELNAHESWLRGKGDVCVRRPNVSPDISDPAGGWVWDLYSPDALFRFALETYGNACVAYDELCLQVFSELGASLLGGRSGIDKAVIGEYIPPEGGFSPPGVHCAVVTMDVLETVVANDSRFEVSASGRCAMKRASSEREWGESWSIAGAFRALAHPGPGLWFSEFSSTLEVNSERPASAIAARWIWTELKGIGLADGTGPNLD